MNIFYILPGIFLALSFYFLWLCLPIKPIKKILIFIVYLTFLNGIYFLIANFYPLEYPVEFKFSYVLSREGIFYPVLCILFLYRCLKGEEVKKVDLLIFVYLAILIGLLFTYGHSSFTVRLGGFKELCNFVILYFIGEYSGIKDEKDIIKLGKYVTGLGLVLSIIVFGEYIISQLLDKFVLSEVGLGKYFYLMFSASEGLYGSRHLISDISYYDILPGNFRSEIGLRYSGISLDPASFSFFMTLPLICSLVLKKRILSLIFITTILLSFGKGGLLLTGAIILYYFWKTNKKLSLIFMVWLVFFICIALYEPLLRIIKTGSTIPHIMFFIEGLKVLVRNPLGYGIGYGGGIGYMAGVEKGVGDTFWGSIISQAGAFGLIAFLVFMSVLVKHLSKKGCTFDSLAVRRFTNILAFSVFIGLLISTVSGAPFLWNAMGIHMLFAGVIVGMNSGFMKSVYTKT